MLSNRNDDLLRQEFKRRYLAEFSNYVGGVMGMSSGQSVNFLLMLVTFAAGSVSIPVAGLLAVGISARYLQVAAGVKSALADAAGQIAADLQSDDSAASRHVDRWLDVHVDDLPGYLDKLDRYEEERRKAKSLIDRINRRGSMAGVTADERALLKRQGVRNFRLPLEIGYPLDPRCQLGNWHFSQLDRAFWRDISNRAGGKGQMLRRILGIARR